MTLNHNSLFDIPHSLHMLKVHTIATDNLYHIAADRLTQVIKEKIISRQKLLLLLSGGSCLNLYQNLSFNIKTSLLPWQLLTIAQVDERFKPKNENEVNAKLIEKTGISLVLREKNIPHFTISQIGFLEESAEQYNQTITQLFHDCQFRAAIMGIGEDGHTAGLLPGYEIQWSNNKFVVGYTNKSKFKQRVSITPKALKLLDYALILLIGDNKKNILQRFIKSSENESINEFPPTALKKIKHIDVFTDIKV